MRNRCKKLNGEECQNDWTNTAGGVGVAFMDPTAMFGLVDRKGITELDMEVRKRLERVPDSLH